jgi:hypothetical protein
MAQGLWRPLLQSPPLPLFKALRGAGDHYYVSVKTKIRNQHNDFRPWGACANKRRRNIQYLKRPTLFGSRLIFCSAPSIFLSFINRLCLINWRKTKRDVRKMLWRIGGGGLEPKKTTPEKALESSYIFLPLSLLILWLHDVSVCFWDDKKTLGY